MKRAPSLLCGLGLILTLIALAARPAASAAARPATTTAAAADAPILADDFESYADQDAFEAVWRPDGSPVYRFETTYGHHSAKSVRLEDPENGSGVNNRYYRNLPKPLTPTDETPVTFSFDLYLSPDGAENHWKEAWQTADVRGFEGGQYGEGAVTGVVSLGTAEVSAEPWSPEYFQGRLLDPANAAAVASVTVQYHTLNETPDAPQRAFGWHRLSARIGAHKTSYYVDGKLARTIDAGLEKPLTSVVIGSDVSSGKNVMWLDNVEVRQTSK